MEFESKKQIKPGDYVMKRIACALMTFGVLISTSAFAKTIRFSTISEDEFKSFMEGDYDDVLEFRTGDTVKVTLGVEGDILESRPSEPTPVDVKRGFFLKKEDDQLLLSWDGQEYRPLKDSIGGKFSASASGDPTATDIGLLLSVSARP